LGQLNTPLKVTERGESIIGYLGRTLTEAGSAAPAQATGRRDWTAKQVDAERTQIAQEFARRSRDEGFEPAVSWIMHHVGVHEAHADGSANLTSFCAAVSTLELDIVHDFLTDPERKRLFGVAEAILKVHGIDGVSRLGFLLADVKQAKALDATRRGRTWAAFFEQMLSWQSGRRSNHVSLQGSAALNTALRALRLGNTSLAIEGLSFAEEVGLDPRSVTLARLARIQSLRLRGDLAAARSLIDETRRSMSLHHEAELELTWEDAIVRAMAEGGDAWRDLFNLCRRGRPHYEATYLLEAHLWARVMPSTKYLALLPKIATIKANAGGNVTRNVRFSLLISVVTCLEDLYQSGLPSETKLASLIEVSESLSRFPCIDRELLAKLALARWAQRANQSMICALLLGEYQALSRRLSDGSTDDVLSLSPTALPTPWSRSAAAVGDERHPAALTG
jgi:hypothetical protein